MGLRLVFFVFFALLLGLLAMLSAVTPGALSGLSPGARPSLQMRSGAVKRDAGQADGDADKDAPERSSGSTTGGYRRSAL